MSVKKLISNIWPYVLFALILVGLIYMTVR